MNDSHDWDESFPEANSLTLSARGQYGTTPANPQFSVWHTA
jgi:hypothetical protein